MPRDAVKDKIVRVLQETFSSPNDRIVLKDDRDESLHLYIVSPKFQRKPSATKSHLVWNILFDKLADDEWGRITLAAPLSPAEASRHWPPMPELNGH